MVASKDSIIELNLTDIKNTEVVLQLIEKNKNLAVEY